MATRIFNSGNHEYTIVAVPLSDGGWTTSIIHTDHSKANVHETRHDSDLRHETEEEALSQGEVVAKHMASKYEK
jgi:hypothetical protein